MSSTDFSSQIQEDWHTGKTHAGSIKVIYCILPEQTERAS